MPASVSIPALPRLQVQASRFLATEAEEPFFYLADTAWELFHRLTLDEATHYLDKRAAQGFTVIQAVAVAELDGLHTPNAVGAVPFHDLDPTRPNEEYFAHVDAIVAAAAERDLYLGFLPTWGDKVGPVRWGKEADCPLFTPESALAYGRFLGERYRDAPLIWILGGDRNPDEPPQWEAWHAMAAGLREGDAGQHLMTFHPQGGSSSGSYFHNAEWLDFNLLQSGHQAVCDNYHMVAQDYQRTPVKPCLDGEPCYEEIPLSFDPEKGYFAATEIRRRAWWAVFAGGLGHTYGANPVWQMYDEGRDGVIHPRITWREALDLPGASQMQHLKNLMLARPFFDRTPDQAILFSPSGLYPHHVRATSGGERTYAMVYVPTPQSVAVFLGSLNAQRIDANWYSPRTGYFHRGATFDAIGVREFHPPTHEGPDWVLVLDSAEWNYPVTFAPES